MVGWLRGPTTETARVDALAGLMEERIQVTTDDEGIVSFNVRWPNASMAYQLVDKAMRNFLEHRRVSEISAIEDSIAILDRSVGEIEAQVNMTIAELRRRERGAPTPRRQVRTPQPVPAGQVSPPLPTGPSAESTVRLARLKSALELRQQEIVRLSEARAQQMAETQTNLLAAQTVYTEGHPTVLALRQTMAQLSRESPELAAARREAQTLESEYRLTKHQSQRRNRKRGASASGDVSTCDCHARTHAYGPSSRRAQPRERGRSERTGQSAPEGRNGPAGRRSRARERGSGGTFVVAGGIQTSVQHLATGTAPAPASGPKHADDLRRRVLRQRAPCLRRRPPSRPRQRSDSRSLAG